MQRRGRAPDRHARTKSERTIFTGLKPPAPVRFRPIADIPQTWNHRLMFPLFAAFMAAARPAHASKPFEIGRTAWVFSTIAHSEWCPAGNVMSDLRTGRYTLTARAPRPVCNDIGLERPSTRGRLTGQSLEAVRAVYLRAMIQGLENPYCQPGKRLNKFAISNGGTPVLVLTSGRSTLSAPGELSCRRFAQRTGPSVSFGPTAPISRGSFPPKADVRRVTLALTRPARWRAQRVSEVHIQLRRSR